MADLKKQFEKAATDVKSLTERPDNDTMLRLYALYKQGSEGDVKGPEARLFRLRRVAPSTRPGKNSRAPAQEQAMKKYVDLVKKLVG